MIGMSIHYGYAKDFMGKMPTVAEAVGFAGSSPSVHNYYPADEALDIALGPRRALYFFQPRLDTYSAEEVTQAANNLKRFPGVKRKVYICSEPTNPGFPAQFMLPEKCAIAIRDYVHFIRTHCPDAEIYGPVVVQENVPNTTGPYGFLQDTFSHLRKFPDGMDIIHSLGLAMNHYRRGVTGPQWANTIANNIGALRYYVATPWGTRPEMVIPELGSPNGDASQQPTIADFIRTIEPTVTRMVAASHWFASPVCYEPGRGFNQAASTHVRDGSGNWKLTDVGRALGLSEFGATVNPIPVTNRFDLSLPLSSTQFLSARTSGDNIVVPLNMTQAEINILISKVKSVKRGI